MLAVGEALPPLPGRRRAALPIDVARTISDLFEHAAIDLCHVHEPFAPSVASTALRHSRALNVGTFHAPTERVVATQVARKVVAARLRPPGRAHRDLRHHRRPAAALLPRRLRDRLAGRRRAGAAGRARARASASPTSSSRSAARCGSSCARCGAWIWRCRGRRSSTPSAARRRRRRCAPTCSRACAGSTTAEQALIGADVLVAASDGVTPAPGLHRSRPWRRARCRSPRAWRSTRRRCATARPGCCSSPTTSRRSSAQLARLIADESCASACALRRARGRGARSPTSSRRSTARWPRAATTPAATRASPARWRAGGRSTSTCTCTPTTATTARRRSRCCWRPRAIRAWARSRSPTTTRSRARSRRPRRRAPTASR